MLQGVRRVEAAKGLERREPENSSEGSGCERTIIPKVTRRSRRVLAAVGGASFGGGTGGVPQIRGYYPKLSARTRSKEIIEVDKGKYYTIGIDNYATRRRKRVEPSWSTLDVFELLELEESDPEGTEVWNAGGGGRTDRNCLVASGTCLFRQHPGEGERGTRKG